MFNFDMGVTRCWAMNGHLLRLSGDEMWVHGTFLSSGCSAALSWTPHVVPSMGPLCADPAPSGWKRSECSSGSGSLQ